MHLQRCIVTFIAGGGNLYQMGDRLFAAFDGCEESLYAPAGDDRLRKWCSAAHLCMSRYLRKNDVRHVVPNLPLNSGDEMGRRRGGDGDS